MATHRISANRRRGPWWAAALLAVVSLFVPTFATAASAAIEVGDSVWIGSKQGYGGTGIFPIYPTTPADPNNPGEPELWAYCIEHDVSAKTKLTGVVGDVSSYLGENYFNDPAVQAKVFWVLAHSYPALSLEDFGEAAGIPGISRNDAIEATQYAIWRYTDLTFDANWAFETPDAAAAYWYLINGVNAHPDGLTAGDLEVTVSVTAPTGAQTAESLVGPFVVHTNQATAAITVDPSVSVVNAAGDPIDVNAVVDGQEIYLDLRGSTAAGAATVTASAQGASGTGKVVSVPVAAGGTATAGSHAQSIILVAPDTARTTAEASVEWTGTEVPEPAIGTTLVDAADQDHNLVWNGGTLIDTVAYENLVPGVEYTVTGELMLKSDGSGTGITGSTTFTPTVANGTVDVTFVVPAGFDGDVLVAFERLFEGTDTTGEPVAVHEDIEDAAQTVTVDEAPVVEEPTIGTSLVDAADQDHNLVWNGGTVVDTVAYENLTPGIEYTLMGELMLKSDGSATGITGEKTFTPTEANGTVDVTFVVPEGYAGRTLVAFEQLWRFDLSVPVLVTSHADIEDAAQTVTVDEAPVVEEPTIGTSLVDAADQDHNLVWNGGTVVDTVTYRNLKPGTEYTVTGELMLKSDGSGTGITGSTTFTPTEANGTVDVTFVVPAGFDGDVLVAFERLFEGTGTTGEPVAVHEDIEDAAQTVTVDEAPVVEEPTIGTSLVDAADQDHNLVWNGGTVVDTVTYRNLKPGTEYTVTGELMLKSDGSGTGITGSTTFTPTEANGTVDVEFTVPKGYAGSVLVAFERVFEGTDTTGEPVAVHEDIEDAAQTVTVDTEQKPTTPKPTTPKPTSPKSTDSPLAVTGGALPGIGIGVAGLLLVAGATVLVTRRARSQR